MFQLSTVVVFWWENNCESLNVVEKSHPYSGEWNCRSNWPLDLLFNHWTTLLTAAFVFPLDHFQSIHFCQETQFMGHLLVFSQWIISQFSVILVSWTFYCFDYTEVGRCVAGAPKQQHSQKQMRVLVAFSVLENSWHYLFHYLLEPILSGFAIALRFTYFSITNTCFLIFS